MNKIFSRILFISGTDTGVGKTTISRLLLDDLFSRSITVEVLKPVETGCEILADGSLHPQDAEALQKAARSKQAISEVCPYSFRQPVSPFTAAAKEGVKIDAAKILAQARRLSESNDIVLIEGAGGLMVPLAENYTFLDFISECEASVLLVVASKLGAVNHTLLSLEVLQSRQIPIIGYVLNECVEGRMREISAEAISTNRETLSAFTHKYSAIELGVIPYLGSQVSDASATFPAIRTISNRLIEHFSLGK